MQTTDLTFTVAEIKPDLNTSLADLKLVKAAYIVQGAANFDNLALIVETLGSPVKIGHRFYTVYQRGRVTALFHEESTRYLPDFDRFELTEKLSIFLDCRDMRDIANSDRLQVCRLSKGDTAELNPLYIPGAWLETMLEDLPRAEALDTARQAEALEAERQALLVELMVGKNI